jgi:gas vesicle protein
MDGHIRWRNNLMSRKNALIGFLLGAAMGLLGGLLLAPKTGRQTRRWIGDQARQGGKLIGRSGEFLKRRAEYEGNRLRNLFHDTRRRLTSSQEFYASDDLVTQRVKGELSRNPKSREIGGLSVDTFNGVVTVRGSVQASSQIPDVLDVIYSVRGVRDIVNELRIGQFV